MPTLLAIVPAENSSPPAYSDTGNEGVCAIHDVFAQQNPAPVPATSDSDDIVSAAWLH